MINQYDERWADQFLTDELLPESPKVDEKALSSVAEHAVEPAPQIEPQPAPEPRNKNKPAAKSKHKPQQTQTGMTTRMCVSKPCFFHLTLPQAKGLRGFVLKRFQTLEMSSMNAPILPSSSEAESKAPTWKFTDETDRVVENAKKQTMQN